MGGHSHSQSDTKSVSNITTKTRNLNAIASNGGVSVNARDFRGEIGISGDELARISESFERSLNLSTQKALALNKSAGVSGMFSLPYSGTNSNGKSEDKKAKLSSLELALGGVAAVATIFALRK